MKCIVGSPLADDDHADDHLGIARKRASYMVILNLEP